MSPTIIEVKTAVIERLWKNEYVVGYESLQAIEDDPMKDCMY